MIRKKIKFSPKLQSSSLDDIKRFVPKDALNTPVISSYNNLPTSYQNGGHVKQTWWEKKIGGPKMQLGGFKENQDYDIERALELGYGRDASGHMYSRDYETGRILKSKNHETYQQALDDDRKIGYYPAEYNGQTYTVPSIGSPRKGPFSAEENAKRPHGRMQELPEFQNGGQATKLDSLNLLQNNKVLDQLIKEGGFKLEDQGFNDSDRTGGDPYGEEALTLSGRDPGKKGLIDELRYEKRRDKETSPPVTKGNLVGARDWWAGGGDDSNFPITYRHRYIKPTGEAELKKPGGGVLGLSDAYVHMYTYDDLAITPWDMLSESQRDERIEKFGISGSPYKTKADAIFRDQTPKPSSAIIPKPTVENVEAKKEPKQDVADSETTFEGSPIRARMAIPSGNYDNPDVEDPIAKQMRKMKQYAKPSKGDGRLFTAHLNLAKEGRETRTYNPGDNTGERKVFSPKYQNGGLSKYQEGGVTDPTDPTSKSDSIALKKYYDLQLKLEGNKDVRPFLGWEEQRRQEEETYKKRNREHIGNIFNYLGIDKNEPTEYFSKQKSMDSAKFNEDDLTLKAYGDSLINANSNFYWENYGNSPDIAHKLIEPVGTYKGDAWNFIWPDPDAQTKTLEQQGFIDPSYIQPQAQVKKESKSPIVKESKKQSLEPSSDPLKMIYPSQEEYDEELTGKVSGRSYKAITHEEYKKLVEDAFPNRPYNAPKHPNNQDYYVDDKGGFHTLYKAGMTPINSISTPNNINTSQLEDLPLRTANTSNIPNIIPPIVEEGTYEAKGLPRYNRQTGEWEPIPTGYVNMGNNEGRVEVTKLGNGGVRGGDGGDTFQNGGLPKYQNGTQTRRDIRSNTERPETRAESEFYRLYSSGKGSGQGHEMKEQPGTGRLYPDISAEYPKVETEGDKHWNIAKFAYSPFFGKSDKGGHHYNTTDGNVPLEIPEGDKARRNFLLEDIYKYNLADEDLSKGQAWRASKKFIRQNVDPLINSDYDKFTDQGVQLGRVDEGKNWFQNVNEWNTNNSTEWDRAHNKSENFRGDRKEISERQVFRGLKDFNRNFRQQTRKDARKNARSEWDEWNAKQAQEIESAKDHQGQETPQNMTGTWWKKSMMQNGGLPKYQTAGLEKPLHEIPHKLYPFLTDPKQAEAVQDNTSAPIVPLWDIAQQVEQTAKQTAKQTADITTPRGALEWNRNWLNSLMHEEMLTGELQTSEESDSVKDYTQKRLENINGITITSHNSAHPEGSNIGGSSNPSTGNINLYPSRDELADVHEVSHSSDRPYSFSDRLANKRLIPSSSNEKVSRYRWNNALQGNSYDVNKSSDNLSFREEEDREWSDYVTNPTETRARLNAIRAGAQKLGIYDPFTEKLSNEQMQELIKNNKRLTDKEGFNPYMQLKGIFTEEEIKDMLNTISYENSSNAELPQARYGGLRKYQTGGAVVTDYDKNWDYKKEDGVVYTKRKDAEKWMSPKVGSAAELAIQSNVFGSPSDLEEAVQMPMPESPNLNVTPPQDIGDTIQSVAPQPMDMAPAAPAERMLPEMSMPDISMPDIDMPDLSLSEKLLQAQGMLGSLWEGAKDVGGDIMDDVASAGSTVSSFLQDKVEDIKEEVSDAVKFSKEAEETVAAKSQQISNYLSDIFTSDSEEAEAIIPKQAPAKKSRTEAFAEMLRGSVPDMPDVSVPDLPDMPDISMPDMPDVGAFTGYAKEVISDAVESGQSSLSDLKNFFKGELIDYAKDFKETGENIKEGINSVIDAAKDLPDLLSSIADVEEEVKKERGDSGAPGLPPEVEPDLVLSPEDANPKETFEEMLIRGATSLHTGHILAGDVMYRVEGGEITKKMETIIGKNTALHKGAVAQLSYATKLKKNWYNGDGSLRKFETPEGLKTGPEIKREGLWEKYGGGATAAGIYEFTHQPVKGYEKYPGYNSYLKALPGTPTNFVTTKYRGEDGKLHSLGSYMAYHQFPNKSKEIRAAALKRLDISNELSDGCVQNSECDNIDMGILLQSDPSMADSLIILNADMGPLSAAAIDDLAKRFDSAKSEKEKSKVLQKFQALAALD